MFPLFFDKPLSLGGVNVFVNDMILLLFVVTGGLIFLFRFFSKKELLWLSNRDWNVVAVICLYLILHALYLLIGIYVGIPIDSCIRRFLEYGNCLYLFLPLLLIKNEAQIKRILYFMFGISICYPVWQMFIFLSSSEWQKSITSSGTIRLSSSGVTPVLVIAILAILIFRKEIKFYILAAFPLASLLLVGHRSVLLSFGVAVMFMYTLTKELGKMLLLAYISGISLLFALYAFEIYTGHSFIDDAVVRGGDTFNLENKTTVARLIAVNDNMYIFKERMFLGIGYNHESLEKIFPQKVLDRQRVSGDMSPEFNVLRPHNFFLRFLSNFGIIGTVLILSIIYLLMNRCVHNMIKTEQHRLPGICILCAIIYFLLLGLMNTTFFSVGYVFWMLGGIILWYGRGPVSLDETAGRNYLNNEYSAMANE
jgi:O-antigen ligase